MNDYTCEECVYRKETECYRFPHSSNFGYWEVRPIVRKTAPSGNKFYTSACAEFKEAK